MPIGRYWDTEQSMPLNILVLETDPETVDQVREAFEATGMAVTVVNAHSDLRSVIEDLAPDLVIVPLAGADEDALKVCRRARDAAGTQTVVLGVRIPEQDRAEESAPEVRLDDPVVMNGVVVEAERLLKEAPARPRGESAATERHHVLELGDLTLDLETHDLTIAGETRHLTPTQVGVLRVLIEHSPRVVPPVLLVTRVWPDGEGDMSAVGDTIMSLRAIVDETPTEPARIVHVQSYGYKIVPRATDRGPGVADGERPQPEP